MRLRSPLFLVVLFSLVAGCDQAVDNLFTFDVDGVQYTFEFDGSDVAGQAVEVTAEGPADILDEIRDQGFGPEEVASVTLTQAEIRIASAPSGVDIGFLDDVSLRLSSDGGNTEVASAEDVASPSGMSSEVDLDVSDENIAALMTAGDVAATLDVSADEGIPDGAYRVEVRFDVAVAVEGF